MTQKATTEQSISKGPFKQAIISTYLSSDGLKSLLKKWAS
jgi:hypothetical protein